MPDPRSVQDWHDRFLVQSAWTRQIRQFLYPQFGQNLQSRMLEVGCGTGVITAEYQQLTEIPVTGIDILPCRLAFASVTFPDVQFAGADAMVLPFADNTFDLVASHFLLLWLNHPIGALKEMLRVLKPGGVVAALAEPDHAARVDAPEALIELGKLQTEALTAQGANPSAGRSLPQWFSEAGAESVQFGVTGFQESPASIPAWFESEWRTLEADLAGTVPAEGLAEYKQQDLQARQVGSRVLWVPTFYAYGKKTGHFGE
jgi:SAM-dependent methyltransferase